MQSKSSRYAYKALLLISGLLAGSLHAQNNTAELPQYADEQHIGVATCANSMCHGVRVMTEPSNVRQNEYHTWLFNDRHACLLYTSPSPRDLSTSRMPSSA